MWEILAALGWLNLGGALLHTGFFLVGRQTRMEPIEFQQILCFSFITPKNILGPTRLLKTTVERRRDQNLHDTFYILTKKHLKTHSPHFFVVTRNFWEDTY